MIVNLTPHAINFVNDANLIYKTVEPTTPPARCNTLMVAIGRVDGVPLTKMEFGVVKDLPEPVAGTIYVVSLLVRQACPERSDLASPGQVVRDAVGTIVGCKSLDIN